MHARKMTAALQNTTAIAPEKPVLLRVDFAEQLPTAK